MQLHGVREVKSHVAQGGTFVGQLVQHGCSNKLAGQLNVLEGGAKAHVDEGNERLLAVHV